ncbi:hypothetical protein C8D76_104108 [Pasteurella langaaensis DSM 22999]|uniref:Chalcone isomerase-like protein n=1 Tax=Alitibacter langaaensis DSM 22999 TaxID=1122935 RepID=A0A2U0T8R3_9PAST|nr:hypothetical protein [Pasteurella langaaensis]PVX39904.1 hypothetical protein C8D76_104108 [Pasteurella langaaensis DSM 22999]
MRFKRLLTAILCLIPTALLADWQPVGKADYNWGPFHVYTISLYTENGKYEENQTPAMLSFDYAKPVEGKNFAITLIKEMSALSIDKAKTEKWLKELQEILPDCSPNDRLNYIILEDKGYFVLNDQVLDHQFDPEFNHAFMDLWVSGKTTFAPLKDSLTGKGENKASEPTPKQPEVAPMQEDDASPQLPPTYKLENKDKVDA